MTFDPTKPFKDQILERISAGHAPMRPRWHFVLQSALVVCGMLILGVLLVHIAGVASFFLRQTGVLFAPQFGLRGFRAFVVSLPWFLIFLSVIFVILLEILVRKFSFAYRLPLLYSLLGIIIFVFVGGFAVAQTSLHHGFMLRAERGELPFGSSWYQGYGKPRLREVHAGTITFILEEGFRMVDPFDEIVTVIVTPETRFPLGINFVPGDRVMVLGNKGNDVIMAFGVRVFDPSSLGYRSPTRQGWHRPFQVP